MSSNPHILQVSELTKKVRFILESELNTVWLCGEISNFINASSGHWYLSLKDQKSQVRCAMFKGNNRRVNITPRNGQQVLVRAKVSLYEPRGDFQLIIEHMEDAGEGLLRQQFEQLKNKLNNEGLFNLEHKRNLPENIQTVGVITSPTGAAVKDIIAVLARRNPLVNVIIYPSLVQGNLAAADICQAIQIANMRNECDVLIIGRGGGSLEDLWPFNEEEVVYTIHQSNIITVSAVGHEVDITLADYVADVRAATPSAAAELVSGDIENITYKISNWTQKLIKSQQQQLDTYHAQLAELIRRLNRLHPEQSLLVQQQKADELQFRLHGAMKQRLVHLKAKPELLEEKLMSHSPALRLIEHQTKLSQLSARLYSLSKNKLANKQQQFANAVEQLHIVSPLATIARGYSITRNKDNKVIKKTADIAIGETVTIQLSDGLVHSQITSK
ncbi:MAG: exodeoxyribonuclease VII large subunit [Thalassotalea sp.]